MVQGVQLQDKIKLVLFLWWFNIIWQLHAQDDFDLVLFSDGLTSYEDDRLFREIKICFVLFQNTLP